MLDYIIRQRDRGQAEVKCLRPRPGPKFWPRGPRGLNLTASEHFFAVLQQLCFVDAEGVSFVEAAALTPLYERP